MSVVVSYMVACLLGGDAFARQRGCDLAGAWCKSHGYREAGQLLIMRGGDEMAECENMVTAAAPGWRECLETKRGLE